MYNVVTWRDENRRNKLKKQSKNLARAPKKGQTLFMGLVNDFDGCGKTAIFSFVFIVVSW